MSGTPPDSEIDVLTHKIDVLTRHCDTVGRDVAEIRKTVGIIEDPFENLDGYLRKLERFSELGVDHDQHRRDARAHRILPAS